MICHRCRSEVPPLPWLKRPDDLDAYSDAQLFKCCECKQVSVDFYFKIHFDSLK